MFTIITSTLNSSARIGHLIKSLSEQSFRDFEWIVVDGGSTDNTLSVVNKAGLPVVVIDSPGSSIYEAWNYALEYVTKNWVIFLGDDDYFVDSSTLDLIAKLILDIDDFYMLSCSSFIENKKQAAVLRKPPVDISSLIKKMEFYMPVPFPSLVLHRRLFSVVGYFDTSYRIAADYDYFIRIIKMGYKPFMVDFPATYCSYGGVSTNFKGNIRVVIEILQIHCKHKLDGCSLLYASRSILKSLVKILLWK